MSIVPRGYDDGQPPSKYGGYSGGQWDGDYGSTGVGSALFGDYSVDISYYKPAGWDDWGFGVPTGISYNPKPKNSTSYNSSSSSGGGEPPPKKMKYTPGGLNTGTKAILYHPGGALKDPKSGVDSQFKAKMSGRAIHGFPGPFRTKKVNAILGEEMHETRKIFLKKLAGRIIPANKWNNARKYKPLTMLFGDTLAENDATTNVEDTVADFEINNQTSTATKPAYALATTLFNWASNRYGDICVMNAPGKIVGPTGVDNVPTNKNFCLQNIWSGLANGQSGNVRMSLCALAAMNSSEYSANAVNLQNLQQMFPAVAVDGSEVPSGLECLFKYESEFVMMNPMNYAMSVEAYVIVSKYPQFDQNPMLFWETSEKERAYEGHPLGANVAPNVLTSTGEQYRPYTQQDWKSDLSRSPTQSVAFNDRYRVLTKKTVVIGAGHTTKFQTSVPWSLIKRDVLEGVGNLAGVTHWVWFRCTSPQLYNTDAHALVNASGSVLVQKFEKISVKPIDPIFVPKLYNFITYNGDNTLDITKNQLINPDGNAVTPGAKMSIA